MYTKEELQRLIRLDPRRIIFSSFADTDRYENIYRNIAIDGRAVKEFIFCDKCKTVLNKPRCSTGNMIRHWKTHNDTEKIKINKIADRMLGYGFSTPGIKRQPAECVPIRTSHLSEGQNRKRFSQYDQRYSSFLDLSPMKLMKFNTGLEETQHKAHNSLDNGCKLVHPSTILISGPTGSGKTEFVKKLILRNWFDPAIQRIVWIYAEKQQVYDDVQKKLGRDIEFVQNPKHYDDIYESLDSKVRNLVIFDDQMARKNASKDIVKFFTQGSHHRNLTVIYLVQNLFDKSPEHRNISLNSQYFFLFRNPRDCGQVRALGQQMLGSRQKGGGNAYEEAYNDATKEPFSYLQIDCRPETDNSLRLRTRILDINPFVYEIIDRG